MSSMQEPARGYSDVEFQKALQSSLMIFIVIALFCSFIITFLPDNIRGPYSDYGSSVLNFVAMSMGIIAVMQYPKGEFRNVGICVTLYLALYTIASITWDVYDQILKINPFPSLADVPWMLAYPARDHLHSDYY